MMSRQAQKREQILAAAREVFMENGYEGTSLDAVIAKSGGSKQTLYRYFGNKRGLFAALVEAFAEQASREVDLAAAPTTDYIRVLEQFLLSYLQVITSKPALAFYRLAIEQSQKDPEIAALFLEQGPRKTEQQLNDYLSRVRADGHLPQVDIDILVDSLLALTRGRVHLQALVSKDYCVDRQQLARQVHQVIQLVFHGVSALEA